MMDDRKLIIVADKKTTKYANYLMQLIGDEHGAAIFTEKQYSDSQAKIKSSTNVVFLGDGDAASTQMGAMELLFDRYSMQCYSLGRRAVLQVDKTIFDHIDYDSFIEFAAKYDFSFSKPRVNLASMSLWFSPKYANPLSAKTKKKIKPESVYDQLFRCLVKVFYSDYLEEFIK